jgi:UDP-glucose 4-epimerase
VAEITGTPDSPEFCPPRPGELQRIALDVGLARRLVGWRPHLDLDQGLAQTVTWLREQVEEDSNAQR